MLQLDIHITGWKDHFEILMPIEAAGGWTSSSRNSQQFYIFTNTYWLQTDIKQMCINVGVFHFIHLISLSTYFEFLRNTDVPEAPEAVQSSFWYQSWFGTFKLAEKRA